ncbi:energy transducer TonB, partial [Mesorhizobium sp. M2A.F.Ca.ET.017.03.2.1]
MTQAAAAPDGLRLPRPGARAAGLWTAAAAIVLAGHVAVAYGLQNLSFADADGGPPPTLAIDLAPLPSTPAIPEEAAMLDTVTPEPPDAAEETDKPT